MEGHFSTFPIFACIGSRVSFTWVLTSNAGISAGSHGQNPGLGPHGTQWQPLDATTRTEDLGSAWPGGPLDGPVPSVRTQTDPSVDPSAANRALIHLQAVVACVFFGAAVRFILIPSALLGTLDEGWWVTSQFCCPN